MTSSLELLAICDEEISLLKRYIGSFPVDTDTLAVDIIDSVGPDGDFLGTDHTLAHFKQEIWEPTIIDRNIHQNWVDQGQKTLRDRAREKVQTILQDHTPAPLDDSVKQSIREIVTGYESKRE
jgi:trimethylamine--corrinoid protein Co-methyltransferase